MNKYIVAYMNFFDNVLSQFIIEAEDEKTAVAIAICKYDKIKITDEIIKETLTNFPEDFNDLNDFAFNSDWLFNIIKLN